MVIVCLPLQLRLLPPLDLPITLAIGFGFLLPTQLRRRRKSLPA